MGVNVNKVQERIQKQKELEASFGFEKVRWWTPKVGENRVRLMPPWTDEGPNAEQFWREVYRHWNIGVGGYDEENGVSFTCTERTPDGPGTPCEICPIVKDYRASGTPADVEIAKQIAAKVRIYSNIVDLKDPVFTQADVDEWEEENPGEECKFQPGDTKVQVWSYGSTVFKQILDIFTDGVDISDFAEGSDLIITREGKGLNTKYRLRMNPRPSAFEFCGNTEELLVDLDKLSPFPREGEVAKALSGERSGNKSLPAPVSGAPGLPPAPKQEAAPAPAPIDEAPPECFQDGETQSDDDPQCVGGKTAEGVYDPCPFLDECKVTQPAPSRRRRPAAKPAAKTTTAAVDALSAEMRDLID